MFDSNLGFNSLYDIYIEVVYSVRHPKTTVQYCSHSQFSCLQCFALNIILCTKENTYINCGKYLWVDFDFDLACNIL